MSLNRLAAVWFWLAAVAIVARAEEVDAPRDVDAADAIAASTAIEELAASARKSLVTITTTGRDGGRLGIGTGFVIDADGLIATNYHVIGEARPFSVQLAGGPRFEPVEIVANDRHLDLAVIRIDAHGLVPLELGDSDELRSGRPVVALGNPRGLRASVVAGVVSATREIDGRPMIQLAMPIEPGNSGGPVIDFDGRVHGIVNMRSAVSANLGFAVPINLLKPLLEKPNPVPMSRWLTIGALDPDDWLPVFDARWRRRAGRILVDGPGSGFGGRSLCVYQSDMPDEPFEVAVTVKLDDESGAAGLIFNSDGGDRHYGFYPSGGRLRLTRFDGPDVYSWTILAEEESPHYRPGEWNAIKVRREADRLLCYVNDELVIESGDRGLSGGRVGLAKFRDTAAEFKNFQLGSELPRITFSDEQLAPVFEAINGLAQDEMPRDDILQHFSENVDASTVALRRRAAELAEQAKRLRNLADDVYRQSVLAKLAEVGAVPDGEIDLLRGALWIARLDNEELDVDAYLAEVESMAADVAATLPDEADEAARRQALDEYLFKQNGFHGSRTEYDNRANSYLNEVIDDREGLPITLSVLYMELARRLDLEMVGIGLPGHFVVEFVPTSGDPQLIDVFDSGAPVTREVAAQRVAAATGQPARDEYFVPASRRSILVRMLRNLLGLSQQQQDLAAMLRYLDAILVIDPDTADARWMRAVVRYQTGDRAGAAADLDWVLEREPAGLDIERVRQLRAILDADN